MNNGILAKILRGFFRHFYHEFAWTYEFVATLVSLGRWNDWIQSVVPYLQGPWVLELGHGPGYLQRQLIHAGLRVVGIDESAEMGLLAHDQWPDVAPHPPLLVRGIASNIPFGSGIFQTVVATFPTEYILDAAALAETDRVLAPGGRLVILPAAWITGQALGDRAAAWLFQITHQAPRSSDDKVIERLLMPFQQAGFTTKVLRLIVRSSIVLVVIAQRSTEDVP